MQGKLPEAVLVYVALQPCQAPNLLIEGGKASLLVGNVPLALAGGEGDRSWGRRPRCQPASAMLWPVGASLSPLDLFLLREFQGGWGEAHKWRWSREAAGSLGEVELEICCVTLDQST